MTTPEKNDMNTWNERWDDESTERINNMDVNFRQNERPAIRDESFYENSYGSGSDSSRTLLFEGNEMIFENDREGQKQDEAYLEAKRENEMWEKQQSRRS